MKSTAALLMALGLALPAMTYGQDEGRPPRRGDGDRPAAADRRPGPPEDPLGAGSPNGGRRPMPPLMMALDANHDGVIDEEEIKNAPEALRQLDKNNDGKLTMDELRPPRRDGEPVGPPQEGDRAGFKQRSNGDSGPADGPRGPRRKGPPADGQ